MARALVLGIAALAPALASACGQTARDRPESPAAGGAGVGGAGAGGFAGMTGNAGTAGSADMAGSAGTSALLPAVTECTQYCENLQYRLPGALCEDWNREGWEPEFCGVQFNIRSCPDYCRSVYETVSPACAAVLPPVVRCVAPTYALPSPPSLDECWLGDCRDQLYTMTSACYGLREQLDAARAIWAASGVGDYQLQYDTGTNVQVVVRAGSEPVVTPPDAVAWTVPALFERIESTLDIPGSAPRALYDPFLGYVTYWELLRGCEESPRDGLWGIAVTPLGP
jgi:hypothetical protein